MGEKVGVVGHSTVGKSTFIKLCSGALECTHGQILLNQKDVKEIRAEQDDSCPVILNLTEFHDIVDFPSTDNVQLVLLDDPIRVSFSEDAFVSWMKAHADLSYIIAGNKKSFVAQNCDRAWTLDDCRLYQRRLY
jgi:ABC-type polysaccharide/polyol phosphate transport system ATPase subunit